MDEFNEDGYDKDGFNVLDPANVINRITGTKFDERGFNKDGIHKETGTKWGEWGVARSGETNWNKDGVEPRDEYTDAITIDGIRGNQPNTFDENGIHKGTGTRYDKNGYDKYGFDKYGFDKDGIPKLVGSPV